MIINRSRELSDKLHARISRRMSETRNGRIVYPVDLVRAVMKELNVGKWDAKYIMNDIYNGEDIRR